MANSPPLLVHIQQRTMVPIRVDIPEVSKVFVYLHVNLRDRNYQRTHAGECVRNSMFELPCHNMVRSIGFEQKVHLRPWTMDSTDGLHFNANMNFRVDALQEQFANLCMSGDFGCVSVRYGVLRNSRPLDCLP